jgi:hypothetical protein
MNRRKEGAKRSEVYKRKNGRQETRSRERKRSQEEGGERTYMVELEFMSKSWARWLRGNFVAKHLPDVANYRKHLKICT